MSFYQGLQAEVVPFRGHNGDQGEAYYARPSQRRKISRRRRHPSHARLGRMDHRSGAQARPSRLRGDLAASLFPRGHPGRPRRRRRARPRRRRRRRRAGHGRRRRAPWPICARSRTPTARSASSASAPAAATPISPPARCPASTPRSIAGAAMSSSTIPSCSTPSGRSRRSISPRRSTCPLLGIFGNDDENPTADQVNRTEAVLKKLGKNYEFHRYDGAGHAFFNTLARRLSAPSRRSTAGARSSPSSTSIWRLGRQHRRRIGEIIMCSYIVEKARLVGSAKGRKGWMKIDTANVYFDHPYHAHARPRARHRLHQ